MLVTQAHTIRHMNQGTLMIRMTSVKALVVAWGVLASPHSALASPDPTAGEKRMNVLLIMCDDLNDYVSGFGGHPQAKTPAIEKLAQSGTLFTHAYCNFPACVPSRNSMLHGIYPHGASSAWKSWAQIPVLKNSKTMMSFFRENGYQVIGTGKIDHYDNVGEWSKFYNKADYGPFWQQGGKDVAHPDVKAPFRDIGKVDGSFGSIESALKTDPQRGDGWHHASRQKRKAEPLTKDPEEGWLTPDKKNEILVRNLLSGKKSDLKEPFFIGVGFIRPHTPLHVEEKYFDRFPLDQVKLSPIKKGDADDTHLKDVTTRDNPEAKGYRYFDAITKSYGGSEPGLQRFAQAYLACVSAVDANIGAVLAALDASPYRDNTIVILTSDHGFQMGEKEWLFKGSPWEESTRLPLVIRVPGMTKGGSRCKHPVSLIDIYPTLVDLCGLKGSTVRDTGGKELQGHSMKAFLEDPENGKWQGPDVALTLVSAEKSDPKDESTKHYTVRSERYRYIRYNNGMEELYDHEKDPYEWTNLADDPKHEAIRRKHFEALKELTGFDFQK